MGEIPGDVADFLTYKRRKEEWVFGHSGTTFQEYFWTISTPAVFLYMYFCVQSVLGRRGVTLKPLVQFLLELLLVVYPTILTLTRADLLKPIAVAGIVLCTIGTLILREVRPDGIAAKVAVLNSSRKPFFVFQRGGLILETCMAILAVDFVVFPRRFCKAEVRGWSVMDFGVGVFIFSSGNVYCAKVLREEFGRSNRWHSPRELLSRLRRALLSVAPILLLGFLRFFSTSAAQYQAHESEYGVHWNFFFTLGFVTLASVLLSVPVRWSGVAGVGILLVHQFALSCLGLSDYILNAPRVSLLSMNKEGVFSVPGYFALYLMGIRIGEYMLRPRATLRDWAFVYMKTMLMSYVVWIVCVLSSVILGPPSRRLFDVPYALSIAAFNLQALSGYLLTFLMLDSSDSLILRGFNRNSLFIFLLANIATGAINMTMQTLDVASVYAQATIFAYVTALAAIAGALEHFKVTLKFW